MSRPTSDRLSALRQLVLVRSTALYLTACPSAVSAAAPGWHTPCPYRSGPHSQPQCGDDLQGGRMKGRLALAVTVVSLVSAGALAAQQTPTKPAQPAAQAQQATAKPAPAKQAVAKPAAAPKWTAD